MRVLLVMVVLAACGARQKPTAPEGEDDTDADAPDAGTSAPTRPSRGALAEAFASADVPDPPKLPAVLSEADEAAARKRPPPKAPAPDPDEVAPKPAVIAALDEVTATGNGTQIVLRVGAAAGVAVGNKGVLFDATKRPIKNSRFDITKVNKTDCIAFTSLPLAQAQLAKSAVVYPK